MIDAQKVRIDIYNTNKSPKLEMADVEVKVGGESTTQGATPLSYHFGRPNYGVMFDAVQEYSNPAGDSASSISIAVLACGPSALVANAQQEAVSRGFAFHKETFLL